MARAPAEVMTLAVTLAVAAALTVVVGAAMAMVVAMADGPQGGGSFEREEPKIGKG